MVSAQQCPAPASSCGAGSQRPAAPSSSLTLRRLWSVPSSIQLQPHPAEPAVSGQQHPALASSCRASSQHPAAPSFSLALQSQQSVPSSVQLQPLQDVSHLVPRSHSPAPLGRGCSLPSGSSPTRSLPQPQPQPRQQAVISMDRCLLHLPYPYPTLTPNPHPTHVPCTWTPSHCRSGLCSQWTKLFKHHRSGCAPKPTRVPPGCPRNLPLVPRKAAHPGVLCTCCPSLWTNPRILSTEMPSHMVHMGQSPAPSIQLPEPRAQCPAFRA